MLAHDLIVWTQALLLEGELAKAEPKRLRYRLLHVAGRLAFSGRRREAPPPGQLAVGGRAPRRVSETGGARCPERLTRTASDPPPPTQSTRPPGPRSPLPRNGQSTLEPSRRNASHTSRPRQITSQQATHPANSHTQPSPHAYRTFRASPDLAVTAAAPTCGAAETSGGLGILGLSKPWNPELGGSPCG